MKRCIGMLFVMCVILMSSGCMSTLDKEATYINDQNVQVISRQNDELNTEKLAAGTLDETLKESRDIRNDKSRKLARSMARSAGNENLPEDHNIQNPTE